MGSRITGIINRHRTNSDQERMSLMGIMNLGLEERVLWLSKDFLYPSNQEQVLYFRTQKISTELFSNNKNKLPFKFLNSSLKSNNKLKQKLQSKRFKLMILKFQRKNFKQKLQLLFLHLCKRISLIQKINLFKQVLPSQITKKLIFKLISLMN